MSTDARIDALFEGTRTLVLARGRAVTHRDDLVLATRPLDG